MTDIKDGVYAYVSGTVGRVFDGRFTVEVKREQAKYPDYVTVWKPEFEVSEGDRVSLKGWFSWAKSEKDGKTYVNVSVNQPKLEKHEPATVADTWNDQPVYNDESPF